jgi:two-component system response regulator FixJ
MAGRALKIDIVCADPHQRQDLAKILAARGVTARFHAEPADLLRLSANTGGVAMLDLGVSDAPLSSDAQILIQSRHTIVTAEDASVDLAVAVMRQGATYFLERPVCDDQLTLALAACALKAQDPKRLLALLSPREREVLHSVVKGETTRAAALRMGISPRTVESHRAHLRGKLGVRHVPALIGLIAGVLEAEELNAQGAT